MGFLANILGAVASFLGIGLHDLWEAFKKIFGTRWAAFILIIGVAWSIVSDAEGFVTWIITELASLAISTFNLAPDSSVLTALAMANTFFPLAETAVMFTVYVGVVVTMTIYRHVKSYVPGVFSGGT